MIRNLLPFFLSVCILSVYGQDPSLKFSNENGIYSKGENIEMITDVPFTGDSIRIEVQKDFSQEVFRVRLLNRGAGQILWQTKATVPGNYIVKVSSGDQKSTLGCMVDPGMLRPGFERPKKIQKYWEKEKETMRKNSIVLSEDGVEVESGYIAKDVSLPFGESKSARGYYVKPDGASPGSLPAVLIVHAAGVKGDWCKAKVNSALNYAQKGNGAICFDLNAHGMLNGQNDAYYEDLEAGELEQYYFQGIEDRDSYYFRGMYLRLVRAIDYLCSQPEWDGKRLIVIGESQGGGQALAAAGLDDRVSHAVAIVPAMCDWGGPLSDRKGGWPQPYKAREDKKQLRKVLPYFDVAQILAGSDADIFTEIGFIDRTCPASSIYATINQAEGKTIIHGVPFRAHQQREFTEDQKKHWESTHYKARLKFIDDFYKED